MKIRYIHHSGFLVQTRRFYFLFDYESGSLPEMDSTKPIFVLSSHSHADHYTPEIFSLLKSRGMEKIRAVLSEDIPVPEGIDTLSAAPGMEYTLGSGVTLTTFRSTDLGVAFLITDENVRFYHAGDLNDWVWEEETDEYNRQMTLDYREQILLLRKTLGDHPLDAAFVVLDPRQEGDYGRGLCFFLEQIPVDRVYPMHYWDDPSVMERFLKDHPEYTSKIQRTE